MKKPGNKRQKKEEDDERTVSENQEQPPQIQQDPRPSIIVPGAPPQYTLEEHIIINRELEINRLWGLLVANKRQRKALLKDYEDLKKESRYHH